MNSARRRFDKYPKIAQLVRKMTPDTRDEVRRWHTFLLTALEGYQPHSEKQAEELYPGNFSGPLRASAAEGARGAVRAWINVMRDVGGLLVDPSAADWCCAPGMKAHPEPCPQHGFHASRRYETGTVFARQYGLLPYERVVRAVCDGSSVGWFSIDFGRWLSQEEMTRKGAGWTCMGRI